MSILEVGYSLQWAAFKISTCPLVWDNLNDHWTSRNEGSRCPMDKQEAIPNKLLFSRKGTNHTNKVFSIDFNITKSTQYEKNYGNSTVYRWMNKSVWAAIRCFLYSILIVPKSHDNTGQGNLLVRWTSSFIFLLQTLTVGLRCDAMHERSCVYPASHYLQCCTSHVTYRPRLAA